MSTKRRKHPPDPHFRRRLAAALTYHEVGVGELARKVGVTSPAVSQWLSGDSYPLDEHLFRVAEVLGEDAEWLRGVAVRGSRGLGATIGRLLDRVHPDDLELLSKATPARLTALLAELRKSTADSGGKRRRKPPTRR